MDFVLELLALEYEPQAPGLHTQGPPQPAVAPELVPAIHCPFETHQPQPGCTTNINKTKTSKGRV